MYFIYCTTFWRVPVFLDYTFSTWLTQLWDVNAGNLGAFTTPKGIGNLIAEASKDWKGSLKERIEVEKALLLNVFAGFFRKLNMKKRQRKKNTFVGSVDINKISPRIGEKSGIITTTTEAFQKGAKCFAAAPANISAAQLLLWAVGVCTFSAEWLLIDFRRIGYFFGNVSLGSVLQPKAKWLVDMA